MKNKNHFQDMLQEFKKFREQDLFADATLICGGRVFLVHRIVLSSCSNYFKEIFDGVQCCHPVLVMNGSDPNILSSLLNYMYEGRANVPHERLSFLMKEALAFKVKGFISNELAISIKPRDDSPTRDAGSSGMLASPRSHDKFVKNLSEQSSEPFASPNSSAYRNIFEIEINSNQAVNSEVNSIFDSVEKDLTSYEDCVKSKALFETCETSEFEMHEKIIGTSNHTLQGHTSTLHDNSATQIVNNKLQNCGNKCDANEVFISLIDKSQQKQSPSLVSPCRKKIKTTQKESSSQDSLIKPSNCSNENLALLQNKSNLKIHSLKDLVNSSQLDVSIDMKIKNVTNELRDSTSSRNFTGFIPQQEIMEVAIVEEVLHNETAPIPDSGNLVNKFQDNSSVLSTKDSGIPLSNSQDQRQSEAGPSKETHPKESASRKSTRHRSPKCYLIFSSDSENESSAVSKTGFKSYCKTAKGKRGRKYSKAQLPCPFCPGKSFNPISRHLLQHHRTNPVIIDALKRPIKKRNFILDKLKKKGLELEKIRIMLKKNNSVKSDDVSEEPKSAGLIKCLDCNGFYGKRNSLEHKIFCPNRSSCEPKDTSDFTQSRVEAGVVSEYDYYVKEVLGNFRDDYIGRLCQTTPIFKYIGYCIYQKHDKNKSDLSSHRSSLKKRKVRYNLRLLAKLYIDFENVSGSKIEFEKIFDICNLESFKKAVDATISVSNCQSRNIMGSLIKEVMFILEDRYHCLKNEEAAIRIFQFSDSLLKPIHWVPLFGPSQLSSTNVPKDKHFIKVFLYIISKIQTITGKEEDTISINEFIFLRRLVLTRLMFLNYRRGGYPNKLLISQIEEAQQCNWLNRDFVQCAIPDNFTDMAHLQEFWICFQELKGLRSMSVIIPKDCMRAIKLLCGIHLRKKLNIEKNKYVFPSLGCKNNHSNYKSDMHTIINASGISKGDSSEMVKLYAVEKETKLKASPMAKALFYVFSDCTRGNEKKMLESMKKVGKILKFLDQQFGPKS